MKIKVKRKQWPRIKKLQKINQGLVQLKQKNRDKN